MLRNVALVLLVVGTIVGTLGGSKVPTVDWTIAGAGLGLLLVAFVLIRVDAGRAAGGAGAASRSGQVFETLATLPERVERIAAEARDVELGRVVQSLTDLEVEVLTSVSENAPSLLGQLGVERFSTIFGAYAAAERNLARAWSAAADGHREEALVALDAALVLLREANADAPRVGA